jgi:hypothetical protein
MYTAVEEVLRDLVAEVAALRSDLAEQHAEIQLVRAELDEVLTIVKLKGARAVISSKEAKSMTTCAPELSPAQVADRGANGPDS